MVRPGRRSAALVVGAFFGRGMVLWRVVDEGGGEVAVGVFLGELARVGEDDRDGRVADLQAGDELEQPARLDVLMVKQRAVAFLDDDRGDGQRGELGERVVQRSVDQRLGEVLERLALDGGDVLVSVADGVVADGQRGALAFDGAPVERRGSARGCRSRS